LVVVARGGPPARAADSSALGASAGTAGAAAVPVEPLTALARTFRKSFDERPDRPEAAGALLALLALSPRLPPAVGLDLLQPIVEDSRVAPVLAAQANYVAARGLEDLGRVEEAAAARKRLGFLEQPFVIGPFGEGRASLDEPFAPERAPGPPVEGASFEGKLRPVAWRKGAVALRRGTLLLDALLRPDAQAVAYVAYALESPAAGWAALRLGSAGPLMVWCNGQRVLRHDVVRTLGFDQETVALPLHAGVNHLLVKVVVTEGPWRLIARVTDLEGRPWKGREVSPTTAAAGSRAKPSGKPRSASVEALLDVGRDGNASAERRFAYARWLTYGHPRDRDAREDIAALDAAEEAGAQPPWLVALTRADATREADDRRVALEKASSALAEAPTLAPDTRQALRAYVLAALGDTARSQERTVEALARWRQALALFPGCWMASLALAQEEQAAGFPALALQRLAGIAEKDQPEVLRAEARALVGLGRKQEAMSLFERLLGEQAVDAELWHERATWRLARGDVTGALDDFRKAAELRPDVVTYGLDLARAQEGAGKRDAALATMGEWEARLPDDGGLLAAKGHLLRRLGRPDDAVAAFEAALARTPEDTELRRALAALRAERRDAHSQQGNTSPDSDELAKRFAADGRALLEAERSRAPGSQTAEAEIWLDRKAVRVHANGLAETFAQRIVEVRTDAAVSDNKDFYVRYTPGAEEVEILVARIYRRDREGRLTVLEASGRDDEDLSEPWYGLYYDYRAEIVRFDGLKPGDVLEVQYVVSGVFQDRQMQNYYGDLEIIAENVPKRRWDYTLLASPSRKFYTNAANVPGLVADVPTSSAPGEQIWRFSMNDVAKIDAEPAMPGVAEVAPTFHVSTYASWAEVGAWYWHLVEEQLQTDEPLRKAVRAVLKPTMSLRERVQAVHDLVLTSTRYVGLEFGIHGFKPYKVTQVFSRRFGDCKDKASLLVAMLKEAGVEAEMVLVRTRRGGRLDPWPASLAVFDHAIAYVPALDLYLDGTAEFSGLTELPAEDQGVRVVRIGPHGTKVAETPVLPAASNKAERRWTIELASNGDADVSESLTITGQAAPEWREHYQTPGEQQERYEKVWTGRHPASTLKQVTMRGIKERNQPVQVLADAHVPHLGVPAGDGGVSLPISVREADFARTYTRLSKRTFDLVLSYPWTHVEELAWALPSGWEPTRLPEPVHLETPFASFTASVRLASGKAGGTRVLTVRTELTVKKNRYRPQEYLALRAFFGQVDNVLGDRIGLRREKTAAGP
jgi:tetratricopeptide (TPR) repeat protein